MFCPQILQIISNYHKSIVFVNICVICGRISYDNTHSQCVSGFLLAPCLKVA